MNVSCSRAELREALRVVGGVVDPRNIKPILKDIHLRVVGDMLELSATDLEVGIKYFVRDVEVKSAGGIVVPVDPLVGIVNESPDERLTLQVKDLGMVVQGKGSRFQVMGLSEEEFPVVPDFPEGSALEVEAAVLKEMIEKSIFAVSLEKQRYALNGVLLVTKEKTAKIEMVGTDGHRLAVIRRKANTPAPFASSAIISVKALQEVLKMIGGEEIVKLLISERQALIRTERGVLVAQLVDGRFPPYKEVIPDDCDKKLEIEAQELSDAIRQASVLTMSGSRTVWLKFASGSLTIESNDPELGEAHVTIDVQYEGAPIEMRFSPEFLLDGLKAIGKERIRLEMKDPGRSAVMRVGPDYVYLIMPIVQDLSMERRQSPAWPEEKPVTTLKSALGAFLKANGLQGAAKHPQLDSAWGRIVGPEFIRHTRVLGFRKGTVEIGVDSSALMNEIQFHRTALLGDLQREIRRPAITGISFSLIPTQERDEGPAET